MCSLTKTSSTALRYAKDKDIALRKCLLIDIDSWKKKKKERHSDFIHTTSHLGPSFVCNTPDYSLSLELKWRLEWVSFFNGDISQKLIRAKAEMKSHASSAASAIRCFAQLSSHALSIKKSTLCSSWCPTWQLLCIRWERSRH